jgi:pyruvate,orthophosphate dikinase
MQKGDFEGIFRAMKGLPVTIRLLDPPLHEFLPGHGDDVSSLAATMGVTVHELNGRIEMLRELNPMLGHRGCRLAITYPEIYEMQVEAIVGAACTLVRDEGFSLVPEIMIPLVSVAKELSILEALVRETADKVIADHGVHLDYLVGTMIEFPRACLTANEVAPHADFFSFGTNDLTQTTFGLSRDDSGKFLPEYIDRGILPNDPFGSMDKGVAELVKIACDRGRSVKPDLKLGICGEHGGDPASVTICHQIGLDYVSCSPYRVPVARMAAAHAALAEE